MYVSDSFDLTFKDNSANSIHATSDYATSHRQSFHPTVVTGNKLDDDFTMSDSNNLTVINNVGASPGSQRALRRRAS